MFFEYGDWWNLKLSCIERILIEVGKLIWDEKQVISNKRNLGEKCTKILDNFVSTVVTLRC